MSLLNPLGLLGLLALPVIVVLHMQRERSRREVVSSLRLWSFLEVQLRGQRPRQIPFTWLLLLDLLIAALFALALSRPQVSFAAFADPNRHVLILFDPSASMLATDIAPGRFEAAREDALNLLGGLSAGDVATVVTFGTQPHWVGDGRQGGLEALRAALRNATAGDVGSSFDEAMALGLAAASPDLPLEIHVFTDGAFPAPPLDDLAQSIRWHIYGGSLDNQAVLDLGVEIVGVGNFQVFVNLANFGVLQITRDVVLKVNGQEAARESFDLPPDSLIPQVWSVTGQPSIVLVEFADRDSLPGDDIARVVINESSPVQVAIVADVPSPLDRAVNAVQDTQLEIFAPDEFQPPRAFDLTIFRGVLPESLPVGYVLVVDPPIDNSFFAIEEPQPILDLPTMVDDKLLEGISLNGLRWERAWAIASLPEGFSVLMAAGEQPLLLGGTIGASEVVVLLPVLEEGNFTRHPAFPIFIANLVKASAGFSLPGQLAAGQPLPLPGAERYPSVRLTTPDDQDIEYSAPRPAEYLSTQMPGIYSLETDDLKGITRSLQVAVNAGSALESNLSGVGWAQALADASNPETVRAEGQTDLTPWLLTVAVILLVLEAWRAWR